MFLRGPMLRGCFNFAILVAVIDYTSHMFKTQRVVACDVSSEVHGGAAWPFRLKVAWLEMGTVVFGGTA